MKAGPGLLRLRANMCHEGLLVVVEDSSLGTESRARERGRSSHTGVGLNNVRRRLQLCFGPDAHLVMESGLNGTTVQFSIPIEKAAHVI
jgi:LytS/YehU family sensor histidine kinase